MCSEKPRLHFEEAELRTETKTLEQQIKSYR